MAHKNVDLYMRAMQEMEQGGSGDTLSSVLADDVVWHEAGNPQPLRGKDAVLQRFSAFTGGTPQVDIKSALADDEHLSVFGHARFQRDGESVEYDYVEEMQIRDGRIVERWSFMDAVPQDVDRFFASM